jgi:outer membrane protein TolC
MTTSRKVLICCVCSLLTLLLSLPASAAQNDPVRAPVSAGNSGGSHSPSYPQTWFSLQVGASVRLSLADKAVARYRNKGLDSFYRYEDTGNKGMWYRIYVGHYPTKTEAKDAAATLVEQKIVNTFMLRKMSADQDDDAIAGPQDAETAAPAPPTDTAAPVPVKTASGLKHLGTNTATTETPVVRLSLLDAIRYGLEGNRDIDVVSYDTKQSQTEIDKSESVYDTRLFADSTYTRDPDLQSSVTAIATDDEMTSRLGLRKALITGGTISTYLELKKSDINNTETPRIYKHIVAPTIELKQPLLNNIGGKKERTAIKIAKYKADISDAEFRQKVLEVTDQITKVYWKLYLYKELVAINKKNLDLAEEVQRREAERFTKGISQQLDVERAKSNAHMRRSTWLDSIGEYHLAMDRLKLMLNKGPLNIDADASVIPVERPMISPVKAEESEAIAKALDNRPEIIKAREQLMIHKASQELAANQKLPTLDIVGRYSVSGYGNKLHDAWHDVSMNNDDAFEVGFQFEWPFGNRSADSNYRKETLARLQADAEIKRVADDIKLDVKQVLKRLATLEDEIKANMSAKEAAEKVVAGEFSRFEIGGSSNEELLRAQDLLAVTSRSLATTIADYNSAVHELASVQGVLPEGIVIDAAGRSRDRLY